MFLLIKSHYSSEVLAMKRIIAIFALTGVLFMVVPVLVDSLCVTSVVPQCFADAPEDPPPPPPPPPPPDEKVSWGELKEFYA